MRITNSRIAAIFNEIADLLDIEGENPFRIRAYRNAARNILAYPKEMAQLVDEGYDLTKLSGIGKDLAAKITELVNSGKLDFLHRLQTTVSPELEELLNIPGLGPKRIQLLHEKLGINSLHDLDQALRHGRIDGLSGFGPKLVEGIQKGLEKKLYEEKRYRLYEALPVAEAILEELKRSKGVIEAQIAGSIRRRRETVKDIDIVTACEANSDIMARFVALEDAERVIMEGRTRSSVALKSGIHVDLRVVPKNAFGAALHHFTGSKAHNIALRKRAMKTGMKVNEYGIFKGDTQIAGKKEEEIFETLGMPYIVPELRENRGEVECALENTLPKLIEERMIRGDLHTHSRYSDGADTIKSMALAAKERGYEYIAVTDHTKHVTIAHGLDEKRLREQIEEIDRVNAELEGITVLKSAEVDILADGSLDLGDSVLEALDFTVCAVHYKMELSKKEQTKRIIKAMENPNFNILAHPTGRLIGLRDPYDVDMGAIIKACRENGCILELNAQPDRLDLNEIHCKMAKDAGTPVAISTDAHSLKGLGLMAYGISQARRGWLEAADVVNTRNLKALMEFFRRS
jgi:DNA polymerase (family 10)